MSRFAPAGAGGVAVLCCLIGVPSLAAQVSGTLDLGASEVHYDQFQPSWAIAATPTFRFARGWTSLVARGTVLRFESGHKDVHGSVVATTFTPAVGPIRAELTADAGASRYLSLPTYSHLFGGVHLHLLAPGHGFWVGGSAGRASIGAGARSPATLDVGVWASPRIATMTLTARHSQIGDTLYTDFEGSAQTSLGGVALDGRLGGRVWSRGAGRGLYGEASATVALTPWLGLVLGGGRFPTDPTRGTIAGRFLTLGFHVATRGTDPAARGYSDQASRLLPGGGSSPEAFQGPVFEVESSSGNDRRIVVRASGASSVEIMGDFTDWQPIPLAHVGGDVWQVALLISSGPHHVEVRVDGGAWRAPAGTTRVADDFAGETGLVIVP